AADERDDQPDRADDKRRPEPFPKPPDESDRRDVVVFEAQPTVPCQSLDAKRLVPGLMAMHDDEWTGGEKGCDGQHAGQHEPAPLLPAGDDERDEQEDARVLEAHREPDCDACELEPARYE